ncbi:hypothetical protein ACFOGJ_16275 [Marinibaculum pumilum]|uniref:Uncharacterized protein n=1 Tax=Marinibaculum pumilum TaxID=1766165 RepID=A0ABV7L2H6_9PROT
MTDPTTAELVAYLRRREAEHRDSDPPIADDLHDAADRLEKLEAECERLRAELEKMRYAGMVAKHYIAMANEGTHRGRGIINTLNGALGE